MAKRLVKRYVSREHFCSIRYAKDFSTTLLLKVLTRRNFIADLSMKNQFYVQKLQSSTLELQFDRLRGNVRASCLPHWKAHDRLIVGDN